MENTLENKGKFLQQYCGIGIVMTCIAKTFQIEDRLLNGVLLNDKSEKTLYLNYKGFGDFYAVEEWQANLKPLSSITDEDVEIIAKHYEESAHDIQISSGQIVFDFYYGDIIQSAAIDFSLDYCVDYLRSKGYAVHYMGLSVEKQIEYGWVKLS